MLIGYALELRSAWFILAFAVARGLGSVYGFLLQAECRRQHIVTGVPQATARAPTSSGDRNEAMTRY